MRELVESTLRGRYRIEREIGKGGRGAVYPDAPRRGGRRNLLMIGAFALSEASE